MMLRAEHHTVDGRPRSKWEVLNECVVGRGEVARPVRLTAEIDGRYLTTYVADGVIAATPTGSTAYALAAGGPILPPTLRNILLVPVAPHLSVDRAIILDEGSSVRLTIHTDHRRPERDGHPRSGWVRRSVIVRASEHRLFASEDPGYLRNLTSRMRTSRRRGSMSFPSPAPTTRGARPPFAATAARNRSARSAPCSLPWAIAAGSACGASRRSSRRRRAGTCPWPLWYPPCASEWRRRS
jgi:hypothetical protein